MESSSTPSQEEIKNISEAVGGTAASTGTKEEVEELKQALGDKAEDIVKAAQTDSAGKGKMSDDAKKLYLLIKTMTALRLKRDDS